VINLIILCLTSRHSLLLGMARFISLTCNRRDPGRDRGLPDAIDYLIMGLTVFSDIIVPELESMVSK
jgi:hypothetical protein